MPLKANQINLFPNYSTVAPSDMCLKNLIRGSFHMEKEK